VALREERHQHEVERQGRHGRALVRTERRGAQLQRSMLLQSTHVVPRLAYVRG
jgi:hypothetical protein